MGSAQSARRIQPGGARPAVPVVPADLSRSPFLPTPPPCLLYTSDAADEGLGVDLGGRRIIKKIFFKQKTAYEMLRSLVGSEMCIRDSSI